MTEQTALEELFHDCGGIRVVSEALGKARQSVWEWGKRGYLPTTELKGSTTYSEKLAEMQKSGKLSPAEIRRIGLNI